MKNEITTERNVSLDYLRVIAMFMVIYNHLGPMRNSDWFVGNLVENLVLSPLVIIMHSGKLAVCIFFLLTGYFFIPSLKKAKNPLFFIIKRIIPLYLLVIANTSFFYIFQKIMGTITPSATWWFQYSPIQWIKNATLLCFLGNDVQFVGPCWYLLPTMLFIVIGAFSFSIKYKKYYNFVRGGATCLLVILLFTIHGRLTNIISIHLLLSYSFYLPQIFTGILIYLWQKQEIRKDLACIMFISCYTLILMGINSFDPQYYNISPYMPSFFYAILLFIFALKINLKSNRIIRFLSEISYCVYLTHWLYGSLISSVFEQLPYRMSYSVIFMISTSASIVFGTILHYTIEKPIRRLLRKI